MQEEVGWGGVTDWNVSSKGRPFGSITSGATSFPGINKEIDCSIVDLLDSPWL